MQTNKRRRFLALAILGLVAFACAAPSLAPTATPLPTATPNATFTPTITLTPTIMLTPTPFYDLKTGSESRSLAGGFAFNRLIDFDDHVNTASVSYLTEDRNVSAFLYAYKSTSALMMTGIANRYIEFLEDDFEDFQPSEPVISTSDGLEKATVDFTGIKDDEPARGRFTLYQPLDSKMVYFIVVAIGDQRWERQGEKVYAAIDSTITFFPIQIKEGCPIHTNPGYGSTGAPIRIGGGLRDGDQRINNYLDALLGPKGELVSYYRDGVEEVNGLSLERYELQFGRQRRTLFFDIYSSSDVSAPSGMHCSTNLPRP